VSGSASLLDKVFRFFRDDLLLLFEDRSFALCAADLRLEVRDLLALDLKPQLGDFRAESLDMRP
jgi:hypothetical protein